MYPWSYWLLNGPIALWNAFDYALDHFRDLRRGRKPRMSLPWALVMANSVILVLYGFVAATVYAVRGRNPLVFFLALALLYVLGVLLEKLARWLSRASR